MRSLFRPCLDQLSFNWWVANLFTTYTTQKETGWWFGTFFIFHNIWDVILPIDELVCFKMVKTTNQERCSFTYIHTHTISQIDIISRIFVPKPTEWTYLYISQVIRHISYLCFLSSLAIIYIIVYIYIYIYITSRPSHRDVSGAFPPIARGLLVGPPECAQWGVPGAGREGNFTRGLSWIPCGESLDEPYIKCLLDTQIALYFGITRQDWLYNIHCISAYFFNDLYKL